MTSGLAILISFDTLYLWVNVMRKATVQSSTCSLSADFVHQGYLL
jgi:hypothetical protein